MMILLFMCQSTIFDTSVRPLAPPKAVPFQTRPVTSRNARVAISWPAPAMPMMTLAPRRDGSIAGLMVAVSAQQEKSPLVSSEHFSVDGSLLEGWASLRNLRPKDGSSERPARAGAQRRAQLPRRAAC
jgi:hypothetical protein